MPSDEKRYTVMPLLPADAQQYLEAVAASRKELAAALAWAGHDYLPQNSLSWLYSRPTAWSTAREYSFSVKQPSRGGLVGCCTLNRIDWPNRTGNLSFWTAASAMRQGAATSGARAVAEFAQSKLGLSRIEIITSVGNKAAQKVARKIGAKREGVLAGRLFLGGEQHDCALYALVT